MKKFQLNIEENGRNVFCANFSFTPEQEKAFFLKSDKQRLEDIPFLRGELKAVAEAAGADFKNMYLLDFEEIGKKAPDLLIMAALRANCHALGHSLFEKFKRDCRSQMDVIKNTIQCPTFTWSCKRVA
jgi:hypothetical protein